jgi:hypothetical protein
MVRSSSRRGTARQVGGAGAVDTILWTLLPSDSACVLASLQSTSHTKPGISVPAICQNISIILHASVWQSSGTYIKKAGLLLLDWSDRVSSSIDSSVTGITFAAVSSRPANMTSVREAAMDFLTMHVEL